MMKFTNPDHTAAEFEDVGFGIGKLPNGSPDYDSIGDGPTRRRVKAWIGAGNAPVAYVAPPPPSLGERKAAVTAYFTNHEGRSLLLELVDDRNGDPPGKALADILLKVT